MSTVNPAPFVNQFRAELIADLGLSPSISCPKCCITYVGEYDDCCRYERIESDSDSDSDSECSDEIITEEVLSTKYELACVFDYYDTTMKEVLDEWTEKLLKLCYTVGGETLQQKWAQKITDARVSCVLTSPV